MSEAIEAARRVLRPSADEAAEAWRVLVTEERDQVERLPNRPRPEDFYGPIAEAFRADPMRTDEPALNLLRELVRGDESWLDVGAGGGRYTLAIALQARRVYAVEPSQGMREVLAASAEEHGIANLEIFAERWPCESEVPVAEVGFISQVGYDIAEIGPFLEQLEAHSQSLCVAMLFERAPISDFAPLWQAVHGEERALLPGLGEFMTLLYAKGRFPQISVIDLPPRTFADLETMQRACRRPLWVLEGSAEDARLGKAIRELAVEVEDGVTLSARNRHLALVTWQPR
jgi:SAM-dependent methyltransferase